MNTKKLLIIAAIAVMLAAAANAYAYHEVWNGWFNSGYLTYSTCETAERFDYVSGQGTIEDATAGSVDSFTIYAINYRTFTGSGINCYIKLWPTAASGWKYTGQEGQKEAYDGTWSGIAVLYCPIAPPQTFDVWGTWDTGTSNDDMYFNYNPQPPNYSAHWVITGSDPDDPWEGSLRGEGGSAGELQ